MANPMSDYSPDAKDFLADYRKKTIKNDPRLEFHQDVIKDFGESYERAYQLWNTYFAEAYKDQSYYLGNQWSLEELAYLNNQRRSSFTYNKIFRLINLIDGNQRNNQLSIKVGAVEDSSEVTARLLTDTIDFVMKNGDGYEAINRAFKNALITGLCFVSPWMDYRDDPVNGDIKFHIDEWNAVIMDPFFTKKDLSDCSFLARRKFLSRTDVISLHPDKEDIIKNLPWGSRDDKFTYMPYARQFGMQKLLNYTEYWRTRWENKDVLVDMQTGETRPWDGDRKRLQLFKKAFPQIEVIRKPVRSVELGIICEGELLYYGKDPFGLNDYSFVPFMAIFEPSYDLYTWKIQSMVRPLRDPQTEINKRRSKMVDLIDNQLNSGWIAKTNSVSNPQSLYKTGQGQVIFIKPEAQITDIQRIPSANIDPTQFQLEAEFEKDMFEILGLSPENVGMAENDRIESAGVLAKMRSIAGWIPIQRIFDELRESKKILGSKILKMIQMNFTPEKIFKITKQQPTPEFFSQQFMKYEIVVEEGLLTDTQKQQQFIQLAALRAMGVNVSDEDLVKNSSLHDKGPMEERFAAEAQAQQQAQEIQTKQAMQQQAVVTNSLESKAQSDQALAAERLAKIKLDQALNAERISRAEEDRTAGVLNLVKAIKELEGMDTNILMQKLALLREVEIQQQAKESESSQAAQETQMPQLEQSTMQNRSFSAP